MSLREQLQSAARSAFRAVGGMAETVTYVASGGASYDVTTGEVADGGNNYTIKAFFHDYEEKDWLAQGTPLVPTSDSASIRVPKPIESQDQKCIIDASQCLPTPKNGDFILRGETKRYKVIDTKVEPSGSVYILHLRIP